MQFWWTGPGFLYVIVQVFARFGKISGRIWLSHGLYFGETKQALIFSRTEQKPARLQVYHPWPKIVFFENKSLLTHSCAKHQFPALGRPHVHLQKIRFWWVFFTFNFLWSDTMTPCWRKLYFCSWQTSNKEIELSITTVIWPVNGWNHFQGW